MIFIWANGNTKLLEYGKVAHGLRLNNARPIAIIINLSANTWAAVDRAAHAHYVNHLRLALAKGCSDNIFEVVSY